MDAVRITERGERDSCLGRVLQLKVWAPSYRTLTWREVWECFEAAYPERWAVQCFPPRGELVDGKSVYHLWVMPEGCSPWGLNLR